MPDVQAPPVLEAGQLFQNFEVVLVGELGEEEGKEAKDKCDGKKETRVSKRVVNKSA